MMRLFLILFLMSSPPLVAAEFTVMHGSSAKMLDEAQSEVDYAVANGLDVATASSGYVVVLFTAEKIVATATDLGTNPTGQQKLVALNGMSTAKECKTYLNDSGADVSSPPSCFLTWEDTGVGPTDCQSLLTCATPGAQLCSAISGEHTMVKRNVAGTKCISGCQQPSMRLRVICQ